MTRNYKKAIKVQCSFLFIFFLPVPNFPKRTFLDRVGECLYDKLNYTFALCRFGDRFWYENGGWPSSFTVEQLDEIRKVKLSRVICDNGDEMDTMQVYAMVLPDHDINPRVPCKSGVLKGIDFSKWRDASFHSTPGGFFG